jgi:hypothetical protein
MTLDKFVVARVPQELAEAFARVAAHEERTVSQEIRRLIKLRVEEVCQHAKAGGGAVRDAPRVGGPAAWSRWNDDPSRQHAG